MTDYTDPANDRRAPHKPGDCTGGCDDARTFGRRLHDSGARMTGMEGELVKVHERLAIHDTKINQIHADILLNNSETSQVLDIVRAGKGFFRILDWLASIIKWTLALLAPAVAFWYSLKGGKS